MPSNKRRLRLSSETLTQLATSELENVAAAAAPPTLSGCYTMPILSCYVQTVRGC